MSELDPLAVAERRLAVVALCGELAHELSAPLAFLRHLAQNAPLPAEDRAVAFEEVERLTALMGCLRRARQPEGETRRVNVADAVARATPPGKAVRVDVPPGATVRAREGALELLVRALVRNALDASGAAVVRARVLGDVLTLEVEDAGPGLADALLATMYRPLATLERGGTGTGIPAALRVAREHGWSIDHAREDGRTRFRVRLDGGGAP